MSKPKIALPYLIESNDYIPSLYYHSNSANDIGINIKTKDIYEKPIIKPKTNISIPDASIKSQTVINVFPKSQLSSNFSKPDLKNYSLTLNINAETIVYEHSTVEKILTDYFNKEESSRVSYTDPVTGIKYIHKVIFTDNTLKTNQLILKNVDSHNIFTQIYNYNLLMEQLKNIGINENTTTEEYVKANYKGATYSFDDAVQIIRRNIGCNAKGRKDVSTNGLIESVINSVIQCENLEEYVQALISVIINSSEDMISSFTNGYTNPIMNTSLVQTIPNIDVIFRINGKNQNFLQWFILTAPLLSFFVPCNSVISEDNLSFDIMTQIFLKGFDFYKILNRLLNINNNKIPSKIDRILYELFDSDDIKNKLLEKILNIEEEQKSCMLSRFPYDDGFSYSSTLPDMSTLLFFNKYYSHKYLDSRHLITIILGSQNDPTYRTNLRDYLKDKFIDDLINKNDISLILQLYTRLKIARYEPIKIENCNGFIL